MRLFLCSFCKTVEEAPDYLGNEEVDPIVEDLMLRHTQRDPMAHGSDRMRNSPFALRPIDPDDSRGFTSDEVWEYRREDVLARLKTQNEKVGFDVWAYEAMNSYAEDALKCYSRHNRPDLGAGKPCIDFWNDSKRIGRPTREGRQTLKENEKLGTADPHICQWCPYFSTVQTEIGRAHV